MDVSKRTDVPGFPKFPPRGLPTQPNAPVGQRNTHIAPEPTPNAQQYQGGTARAADGRSPAARRPLNLAAGGHALKPIPLVSKKSSRAVDLNGRVPLHGEPPDSLGFTTPVCVHFAIAFAKHEGKKRELLNQFSSRKGIREVFNGRLAQVDRDYTNAIVQASEHSKHLVHESQLGQYLSGVASALDQAHAEGKNTSSANCLLMTPDHTMAVHVERKTKGGQTYYAVKVLDPNNTNNYKRPTFAHPSDLAHLQLKDLLIQPDAIRSAYAPTGETLMLSAVCLESGLKPRLSPLQCTPEQSQKMPSTTEMHLAISRGVHSAMLDMAQALNGNRALSAQNLFTRLQAKSRDGFTGLSMAMQYGNPQTVKAFGALVRSSRLSDAQKMELLAAKNPIGNHGLCTAVQFENPQVIHAFGEVLRTCGLPDAHKVNLLAAKTTSGIPSLYTAMQTGQVESVKAFGAAIEQQNLAAQDVFDLVAARCSNGASGIEVALFNGHIAAASAGCELLTSAGVHPQKALELLQGCSSMSPGLGDQARTVLNNAIAQQQQRLTRHC
jgi:hypothetical protein